MNKIKPYANFTLTGATLAALNRSSRKTLNALMGLEFTSIGPDFIQAELPVDVRTHQPYGLLHGGASAALIETLGSVASYILVSHEGKRAVGIEINANHVRGITEGKVTGTVRALHVGRTTHVWEVRIHNPDGQLISAGRLTVAIVPGQSSG